MVQMMAMPSKSSLRSYRGYLAVGQWNPSLRSSASSHTHTHTHDVEISARPISARPVKKMHLHKLPAELVESILSQGLDAAQVMTVGTTCKRLSLLILDGLPELWFRLSLASFTTDDLLSSPIGSNIFDALKSGSGKDASLAMRALCAHNLCRQCGVRFFAGACRGCKRHTGVLISGSRMNGHNALWTCCSLSRHSDGCTPTTHVSTDDGAAWGWNGPKGCARSPLSLIPSSSTGVPGSRVRGRTPEFSFTFLDLIEPMPALTL